MLMVFKSVEWFSVGNMFLPLPWVGWQHSGALEEWWEV